MSNLNYSEISLSGSFRGLSEKLQTSELNECVQAYERNMDRVDSLLKLPAQIVNISLIFIYAILDSILTKDEPRIVDPEKLKGYKDGNVLPDLVDSIQKVAPAISYTLQETSPWKEFAKITDILIIDKTKFKTGIEAVISGAILGTWTAFESLAADLWEAAVNIRPDVLSLLEGKKARKKIARQVGEEKSTEDGPKGKNEEENTPLKITIHDLRKFNYNLSTRMGTILCRNMKFDTFEGIRDAYTLAFSKDFAGIDSVFAGRSLLNLACIRNLIVHRAGIVDSDFKSKMKNTIPYDQFALGEALPINGLLVEQLINPAIQKCVDLIVSIDIWIESHK